MRRGVFLELNRIDVVNALPESGRIEAESYAVDLGMEYAGSAESSNGAVAKKVDAAAAADTASITFAVETAGTYVMAVGAGCAAWASWLSPVSVSVNGGAAEDLADYRINDVISNSNDGFRSARMTRPATINLEAGVNTVTFSATPRTAGGIYYSLDYIDLIWVQDSANIGTISENSRIEAEDFAAECGLAVNLVDVSSKGANAAVKDAALSSDVFSIAFNVEGDKEASYVMSVGAACAAWAPWLSPLAVSVNGRPKEAIDTAVFTRGAIQGGNDGFRCADLTKNTNITLYNGLNVITFYASPRSSDFNGGIFYAIDYIDLVKAKAELTAPEMTLPSEYMVGDTGSILVTDGENLVTPDSVYQMTYASSDEDVAVVDGSGTVTAKGAGTAEITVALRVNKNSAEVAMKQTVTVRQDGVYLTEAENTGGTVTFTVNTDAQLENVAAVVASYAGGRLVDAELINIDAVEAYGTYKAQASLSSYEEGQEVKIFLWNSIGSMIPLCENEIL